MPPAAIAVGRFFLGNGGCKNQPLNDGLLLEMVGVIFEP